jgi:hypothetical protein
MAQLYADPASATTGDRALSGLIFLARLQWSEENPPQSMRKPADKVPRKQN